MLVLGLLFVSMLIKPVLASWGEMHELAHDPTGQHSHVDVQATQEHRGDEDKVDQASPLHALLHFAHCCGQSAAAYPPVMSPVAGPLGEPQPAPANAGSCPSGAPLSLFRPPITA